MIKQIAQFIAVLNSRTSPGELALGAVLGMFGAFLMPSPLDFGVVFFLVLILNCNMSFFFFSLVIFKALAFGIDILGDKVGFAVLNAQFFGKTGAFLMNMPVVPFTKFNYTVIMGDFIIAAVLTPAVWFAMVKFIPFYRDKLQARVDKSGIMKLVKVTDLYKFYQNYKGGN
jgi:uncharacterized protein (TIGR03546 family)